MRHLDLFSGIGGFAYAVDQVWGDAEHIFCDNDKFCRAVLKKHWPEARIYDDIKEITANTFGQQLERKNQRKTRHSKCARRGGDIGLLTGGFPCQPFSAAGARRGTADDRYLWPEMLRVIRLTKPQWVVAENVGGLVTWDEGMVLEQVCADLEAAGYEVQPLIIPAIAVNAPHRRDRVWFVAHAKSDGYGGKVGLERQSNKEATKYSHESSNAANPTGARLEGQCWSEPRNAQRPGRCAGSRWDEDWTTIATELCSVDDGLPAGVGDLTLTKAAHRKEQIKAYGNAIVPAVAVQIMEAIRHAEITQH
jgi:DNA (cytosine-5)-methyltransferase 1